MSTLRLFVAVPCPATPGLRQVLSAMGEHRDVLKPVSAEQLHVTLRFLGEQPAERVPALAEAMQQAVEEAGTSALRLAFSGLTTLPPNARRPPRTVCAGFADAAPLITLAEALDRQLDPFEPPMPARGRAYRPHLTLARVKASPRQKGRASSRVRELVAEHRETDLGRFVGDAVHLIASQLTPQGPVHRTLHNVALHGR